MIGPIIGAAASSLGAAASSIVAQGTQSLRGAAGQMGRNAAWLLAAGVAMAMGGLCLTGAAYFALSERLTPAESLAILGAVYCLAGGFFFLMRRRAS